MALAGLGRNCLRAAPGREKLRRMPVYEFDDLELDTDLRRLSRGGRRLEIGRTLLDLLIHLVRNPGRAVSKDELLALIRH